MLITSRFPDPEFMPVESAGAPPPSSNNGGSSPSLGWAATDLYMLAVGTVCLASLLEGNLIFGIPCAVTVGGYIAGRD
jgi:hypothetical protein